MVGRCAPTKRWPAVSVAPKILWVFLLIFVLPTLACDDLRQQETVPETAEAKPIQNSPEGPTRTSELSPGVVLTQPATQGGQKGWHRAQSPDGGFSVELPLPSTHYRLDSKFSDGTPAILDTIVANSADLEVVYTVRCGGRADGTASPSSPKETATKYRDAFAPGAKVETLECAPPRSECFEVEGSTRHGIFWAWGAKSCSIGIGEALPSVAVRQRVFDSFLPTP